MVGGSSGIGLALVKQLLINQASVFVMFRRSEKKYDSNNIYHLEFDVVSDNFSKLESFVPETLHGFVYCPGTINLKSFSRLSEEDFLTDFNIDVVGAVKALKFSMPRLKKGRPSSVVLFSTVAAKLGLNFHASIATAKSALEGFSKSLAAKYANSGICFNVVAPSITPPLAEPLLNIEQKITAAKNRHPLKAIGKLQDMVKTARFLASEESAWITGQVFPVDGGLSNLKPF